MNWIRCGEIAFLWFAAIVSSNQADAPLPQASPSTGPPQRVVADLIDQYCIDCHNSEESVGGLSLDRVVAENVDVHSELWEKVIRKLRVRQMPPTEADRPDEQTYLAAVASLSAGLDAWAAEHPRPGRTDTLRRLNRTEYQNAVRDLLSLEVDVAALLPRDESSHGFDNVTVGELSPMLLERYISAAQKISRLAMGSSRRSAGGDTFRIPADLTQEQHVAGLPLGTRGGTLISYNFPQDGQYDIQLRLARDRNEHVEGLHQPHELEVLLDRERMATFTILPPSDDSGHQTVDAGLKTRIAVPAGPHKLGVTFVKNGSSLLETKRQPFLAHFNMHRHPRITPAIYQISITGPYVGQEPSETPSRRRIFVCKPEAQVGHEECAKRIVATLLQRAYRRPVGEEDLRAPMAFFRDAVANGSFDAGIEAALSAVLVNPQFLFRIERDPEGISPGTAYRISDIELASRLSFFLWSSIPDDELLAAAIDSTLSDPAVLEYQVRRMLSDDRSRALATNFAGQWLHLRNLDAMTPDLRLFPDFDDNLRQALRQETELLFDSVRREDRSVQELLRADYTFLNERLAKHYGIPHIYGSRFRRVVLDDESHRGGLLRHGSILTVTSYATRTSPVIRGKWILENVLGTPPPPPPANVPALRDNTVSASLSVRERLAEHRANPACASCHNLMDPVGFALENFDAVGRWRTVEEGMPIDASGRWADGREFVGVSGLEDALLQRPEVFVGTLAEKLLTFALGRGMQDHDAPAIRKIVREAQADDYCFSSLVLGVTKSVPFQMRRSE